MWHNLPEECNFDIHHYKNLKFNTVLIFLFFQYSMMVQDKENEDRWQDDNSFG
jgi:hypothetical protein